VLPSNGGQQTLVLKVFVSSVFRGYEEHRAAIRGLVEALGHEAVLIGETAPALPRSSQRSCLDAVAACDVMVLVLGAKYGTEQRSGKSATHEEWTHARDLGKEILALKERVKPATKQQANFIQEVRDYETGVSYKPFSTLPEMQEEVVRALRRVEQERRQAFDFAQRFPESVSSLLESMRTLFPDSLIRTQEVMRAAAEDAGANVLARLAEHPPAWATDPGPLVWEALSEFIGAAGLGGGSRIRSLAIDAGSQHTGLYAALNAIAAAADSEEGERASAGKDDDAQDTEALAEAIPTDDPLREATVARVRSDPEGVLAAVSSAAPQDSDDPGVAELGAILVAWAHCESGRPEEALAVLAAASQNHPDRTRLLLAQARLALALGLAAAPTENQHPALLEQAHRQAMQARQRLRQWGGPSHRAASVACTALVALHDPKQALRIGLPPPEGEATQTEAADAEVQQVVADALLLTGRHDDIDRLAVESFEPWRQDMIHAMQAHERNDRQGAIRMMRKALAQAPDDDARKHATFGLALFGKTADMAGLTLTDEESALFAGVAAIQRGNPGEAVDALRQHRRASQLHADWLCRAQQHQGDTEAAIETLQDAVHHFGPDPLSADLVELMTEDGSNNKEAEVVAVDALARSASPETKRRLRRALVHLAQASQAWHKAYEHAAAMHSEDPQDYGAGWAAVLALYQDGRYDDARRYLLAHGLPPATEDAARLAALLLGGPTAQQVDAATLLELAERLPDSEKVLGSILQALMTGGKRVNLTDEQAEATRELLEEFIERFESSEILWQVSATSLPELAEQFRDMVRERHSAINWQLVGDVRAGRAPHGLLWAPTRPYATVLLGTGGCLTAVSANLGTRQREIATALAALGSTVVIDTSAAVVASRTEITLNHLAKAFGRVLVPDQLLTDASRAITAAKMTGNASLSYEPSLDRIMVTEFSPEDKNRMVESAERVLSGLKAQQRTPSSDIRPEWYPPPSDLPHALDWDAALRIAAVQGLALWCDDAALRHLADIAGVATFGTYALYEALDGQQVRDLVPDSINMRMQFIRAQIADVPINLEEMIQATDDSEGPDAAWALWLTRPASWQDPGIAFARHVHRMQMLIDGHLLRHVPELVYASCLGLGSAVANNERPDAMGAVLAGSLLELEDAERMADLLVANARAASANLDPRGRPDPLPSAATMLLQAYETATDASVAAQQLIHVFSRLPSEDRRIVTSVIPHAPTSDNEPAPATTSSKRAKGQQRHNGPRQQARLPGEDDLATALRARRKSLGLTQQALAERCGMPRPRVSNVESEMARPRISTVLALVRAMRSSLSLVPSSGCPVYPRTGITTPSGLGHAIRAIRGQLQLRQQDLAERSGVHRSQISKIEAGGDAITGTVLRLVGASGLTLRLDHDDPEAFVLEDVIDAHTGLKGS